jgi:hypothetical protein
VKETVLVRTLIIVISVLFGCTVAMADEISGVFIDKQIQTASGNTLMLNGAGVREKFWVDVYVGSLYLAQKSADITRILSTPGPWRIQLDFVYKEVAQDKLLDSWRAGFEQNQSAEALQKLQPRIEVFYGFFDSSAIAKDQFRFDYLPGSGTQVSKNQQILGVVAGKDFSNALLEIWLGNHPADKSLKKAMLGL